MNLQRLHHPLRLTFPQRRAAFDVGEEEGDRAYWQRRACRQEHAWWQRRHRRLGIAQRERPFFKKSQF